MNLTDVILIIYAIAIIFDLSITYLYSNSFIAESVYSYFQSSSVFSQMENTASIFSDIANEGDINQDSTGNGQVDYYKLLFEGGVALFNMIWKLITIPTIILHFIEVLFIYLFGDLSIIETFFGILNAVAEIIILVFAINIITGRSWDVYIS